MSEPKRVRREDATSYEFAIREPQITVAQGEPFVLETRDALNGHIRKKTDHLNEATLGKIFTDGFSNPAAGPVFVEGAEPGDTLVVDVLEIIPAPTGFIGNQGGAGVLLGSKYSELSAPFTELVEHRVGASGTTSDGTGHVSNGAVWNLEPHIGCLGVVPSRPEQGYDTFTMQSRFGGNLDATDIKKGHKIYYPVAQKGALLYAGDVQASQATEFAGSANECEAEVTLACSVIKGKQPPFVRIETPTHLIQLASQRPWEDAVRQAHLWLLDWLVEDHGMKPQDVITHFNGNPDVQVRVYCTYLSEKTKGCVGVQFPKASLKPNQR
ncbi:acetamidase/formamidase family protein [Ensifer sp. B1-9]|uniref:acetamidase/formamidase family protein n=1 Tax=Ensifer sp. B1-9 TaxID=3141455 RepID=UPI003D252611